MSRQRRGSARRPSTARPTGSPPEAAGAPRPAREPKHDGRVRAGSTTRGVGRRGGGFSPGWLLAGAAAVALAAVALLTLPRLLGGAGGGGGAPGSAIAGCPTSQPPALGAGEQRAVTLTTELGDITVDVEADLSPIAAGNFVALAECGFYDNVGFHRVVPGFVIQVGDPSGTGGGGPGYTIEDEPVTTTYERGTVAMARSRGPNSVGSQFFVVLDDAAAQSLGATGYNNYQIIGSVDDAGMAVADEIAAAADAENPTDPVLITDVTVRQP